MVPGIDPEDHSEFAGVFVEMRFDELQRFRDDIVHPAFGEAGDGCNFFVRVFLFPAEAVYLLFLKRELAQGLIDQLLVFAREDEFFQ